MIPKVLNNFIKNDEELSLHQDFLNNLIVPSIDITVLSEKFSDLDSRFSGKPFVPEDFEWPKHELGEYRFLCQINLSNINNVSDLIPSSGLLSFFYLHDDDGEIFWGEKGYVIAYYWDDLSNFKIFNQTQNDLPKGKKIVLHRGIEIPRNEALISNAPFDTEALYELLELEGYVENYMLGYPSFNTLAYNPTPGDNWVSLLTLVSDDDLHWCWQDGHKLMIFIEKDKLFNKDFSNLMVDAG